MHKLQTHTVEGYSYLKKPTFLGSVWIYFKEQLAWPDVLRWKGSVLLPTLPGVVIMTGISCLVCLFHLTFEVAISIPVSVLGTVSVALGLLLAFRVNTAYDRYWEGRKLIQTVMATIRNVTRQVWINIPAENEQDHLEKMRCVKLLLAFFVATKHHLRHEYGTHYPDLEVLLPPKWVPLSTANSKKTTTEGQKSRSVAAPVMKIDIDSDDETDRGFGSVKRKGLHILSKAPGVLVSITDTIKPKTHGNYMESDEPTHIFNVRRSLIEQEFPNSKMPQMSTAVLKNSALPSGTTTTARKTLSSIEQQTSSSMLDESTHLLPKQAAEDGDNEASSSSRVVPNKDYLGRRFLGQHRKSIKRHLDHSEFTSEEDLPYQGDSDLSLPLEILFRVTLYINQAKAAEKIESTLVSAVTSSVDTLVNSLTAFERIVHTPIPKAYNIHLKQAVVLYIFFLPFALVDTLGWLVAPIVALVSFTLFGIEAIGSEIEDPFGYDDNDLPLNRYCDELKKEVEFIIYHIPTRSTSILLDGH